MSLVRVPEREGKVLKRKDLGRGILSTISFLELVISHKPITKVNFHNLLIKYIINHFLKMLNIQYFVIISFFPFVLMAGSAWP